MRTAITSLLILLLCAPARAAQTLQVYFIDVEGGQATLFVSPSGESLLVDTGWPDAGGRDADRIVSAAQLAGVKQIDYLVVTHYHIDHVGGVPQLAERIPIRTFVDHGPSVESRPQADQLFSAYKSVRDKAKHLLAKPGDLIPIRGIDVRVLTAAGSLISKPLPGAGAPNPLCAGAKRKADDPSENAQSIGLLITYGKFRMIDLGDLTWNKELGLACPDNKIGTVEVYLSTHHGLDQSGAPPLVQALHPLVAIMNNGAKKGGSPEAWQTIHSSPGLEDIWQLHYALEAGKANNAPEAFIANLEERCQGNWIKLSAEPDGQFTVTNGRNGKTKAYQPVAQ
jgi:beta-lactamase superfamily II metal-dependent hydrolase